MDLSHFDGRVLPKLELLYGKDRAPAILGQLRRGVETFRASHGEWAQASPGLNVSEKDALLIAYGDQITAPGATPLATLHTFLRKYLLDVVSGLHLLPHYPWTSDDGFSVVDYRKVDPALGTWEDVTAISRDFRLMLDAVINHASKAGPWFQGYLKGENPFTRYFIEADPKADTSAVFRPRDLPLLTEFDTSRGKRFVWTTFSEDQVDLNFAEPELMLEVIDILLGYAHLGGGLLRLDAIGYLWKKLGTDCFHLPETHAFVRLLRDVFNVTAPHVLLVPEINDTLQRNLPYLGSGGDEAQMIYNFTLCPLLLHAIETGSASRLSNWLSTVKTPPGTTLFNFLASHDGIGVRPAESELPADGLDALVRIAEERGGKVSHRATAKGPRPYELNITLYDMMNPVGLSLSEGVSRFRLAHSILVSLAGVPGIYFHSFLGTPKWTEGFAKTHRNRTLNRRKFSQEEVTRQLEDLGSRPSLVFSAISELLRARRRSPELHPEAPQRILDLGEAICAIERTARDGSSRLVTLHNLGATPCVLRLDVPHGALVRNVLRDEVLPTTGNQVALTMGPYATEWVRCGF